MDMTLDMENKHNGHGMLISRLWRRGLLSPCM